MMRKRRVNLYNGLMIIGIMLLVLLAFGEFPLFAQEQQEEKGVRNWELMIGGGGIISPKYSGSDKTEFQPVPFILARYETRYLDLFIEGQKAGVTVKFSENIPVSLFTGITLGEDRDNGEMSLLKGTPTLENSYRLFGGLDVSLPFAEISSQVRYVPITADYDEVDRSDDEYTGLIVDVDMKRQWWLIPFIFNIGAGVSWMNGEYAEATYSVKYQTERLHLFEAESGIHDMHVAATVIMMFSERAGTALVGEGAYLLGDAADSPLTKSEFQPFGGLFVFYRF